jgi:hypothetical protein
MQPGQGLQRHTRGVTGQIIIMRIMAGMIYVTNRQLVMNVGENRSLLVSYMQMTSVCMTCTVMSGNGQMIAGTPPTQMHRETGYPGQ